MQLKHSIVDGPALCLEECKSFWFPGQGMGLGGCILFVALTFGMLCVLK